MQNPPYSPKKIAPNKIRDYIKSLSSEVVHASIYYKQYMNFNGAIAEYANEMNNSPAFWNLYMNATLIAARSALFRAFDVSAEGVNLHRLMANIEDHLPPANPSARIIDQADIDADRAKVARNDPLIQTNLVQRNKEFAHKDFKYALRKVKPQMTHGEIKELIERAVEILNRYADAILAETWATDMWSQDDYKHVLTAIKEYDAAMEKRFDEGEA